MRITVELVGIVLLALVALALGSCGDRGGPVLPIANAQGDRAPERDLAGYWLRRNCSVGPRIGLAEALEQDTDVVGNRARFTDGLDLKVPKEALAAALASARTRYEWWQELLKEEVMAVCIPQADREYLVSMSEDEYLALVEADFKAAYQAKSITGLGVVGTDDSEVRARVKAIAADRRSPASASARWTLDRWNN